MVVMSLILAEATSVSDMVFFTWTTMSRVSCAESEALRVILLAVAALSAFSPTVALSSSMLAAVSTTAAAPCPVRAVRASFSSDSVRICPCRSLVQE